jgi:aerotaxis receptor
MRQSADPAPAELGEIQYGFDELFFSRTDTSGRIQFGNSVFQRVSVYSWDELLGKPHKIVRHLDTPRAVFWLLWKHLQEGRPIGAYVKNRAKDGRFYWVFAIATPIEGGYISVRLRPSSALFAAIKQEYAEFVAAERRADMAPEQSADAVAARLATLGFSDYASFMATALGAELAARDERLGRRRDAVAHAFNEVRSSAQDLLKHSDAIAEAYADSENVPFNFRVLAAQLGDAGAAIGVISGNYSQLSAEMKVALDHFIQVARELRRTVDEGSFLTGVARVQREMASAFKAESKPETEFEMATLSQQQRNYTAKARRGLDEISRTAEVFARSCSEMTRLAAGLEVTRIMGKVECARHVQVSDRLGELLSGLEVFQRIVWQALREIDANNDIIRDHAKRLLLAVA